MFVLRVVFLSTFFFLATPSHLIAATKCDESACHVEAIAGDLDQSTGGGPYILVNTLAGLSVSVPAGPERVLDSELSLILAYEEGPVFTFITTYRDDLPNWFEGSGASLPEFTRMVFDRPASAGPPADIGDSLWQHALEIKAALLRDVQEVRKYNRADIEIFHFRMGREERAFVVSDKLPHVQLDISGRHVGTKGFKKMLSTLELDR